MASVDFLYDARKYLQEKRQPLIRDVVYSTERVITTRHLKGYKN